VIKEGIGTQFDPWVARMFLSISAVESPEAMPAEVAEPELVTA
jgi:hypothetical protein